jgi:hypothetical protein
LIFLSLLTDVFPYQRFINNEFFMVNLRYRNARDVADRLGQVFTPPCIAALLADSIPMDPNQAIRIIDLGAGDGVLANALLNKYKYATATLVEVDADYVRRLKSIASSRVSVIHADALGNQWVIPSIPNLIVSNPPYNMFQTPPELKAAIGHSGLAIPFSRDWVRGDVAFMARAWGIASLGAKLGLIIASPIIRNANYRPMRAHLIRELRGLCITRLNEFTFQKVEVSAFLLTGERAVRRNRNVLLRKVSVDGFVLDEIEVSHDKAIMSLDIEYHLALRRMGLDGKSVSETLESIGTVITRGSKSQREFEKLGLAAFHTSDFPKVAGDVVLSGQTYDDFHVAKPGDILIPRVGSRCLVRQARVRDSHGLFTDCIYRLTVSRRAWARVWETLNSSFGAEWRIANASGSCAKHLPLHTLLSMPLVS